MEHSAARLMNVTGHRVHPKLSVMKQRGISDAHVNKDSQEMVRPALHCQARVTLRHALPHSALMEEPVYPTPPMAANHSANVQVSTEGSGAHL